MQGEPTASNMLGTAVDVVIFCISHDSGSTELHTLLAIFCVIVQKAGLVEMCTLLSSVLQGSGSTAGNLFIVGVQYTHEGVYTCQVTTGMEHQAASAILTVNG